MALPNPSTVNTQYNSSIGESISTGLKDAFVSMQTNFLSKSPILKMLGKGVLDERARVKQQERYEKTGRDPSGRKLTKDQLEERASKRAERGALGEIRDTLQFFKDTGFGGILSDDSKITFVFEAMGANILLIKQHLTEGITRVETLNRDEATNARLQAARDAQSQFTGEGAFSEEFAAEKEKEDDKDQAEAEKKSQGFFTKLFGRKKDGSAEGGGLLGLLAPLLGLFSAGGILGFIGTILAPIGAAIMAILPVLAGAITILLPIILAGAAGLILANWIDGQSDELLKSNEKLMSKGEAFRQSTDSTGKKLYKVEGEDGKISHVTAEQLGKTDEQLSTEIENDPMGNISKMQHAVVTKNGIATEEIAAGQGADAMLSASLSKGEVSLKDATIMANMHGYTQYRAIREKMKKFQDSFRERMNGAVENDGNVQKLVNEYNDILAAAVKAQAEYPSVFNTAAVERLTSPTGMPIFAGSVNKGKFDLTKKAEYDGGGDSFWGAVLDDEEFIHPSMGGLDVADPEELKGVQFNPTSGVGKLTEQIRENEALRQRGGGSSIMTDSNNTNVVNNSPNTTVMTPLASRPSGAQMKVGFNGVQFSFR